MRPEHITEARETSNPNIASFSTKIDVTEPMGMETYVYFTINGHEVCGRVAPKSGAREGQPMTLAADLNNMHLIDDASGRVL